MVRVYKGEAVQPFVQAMQTRRVDVIGIGDSNQILSGHGWDHGMQAGLARRLPMYATSLLACRENSGNGNAAGYRYKVFTVDAGVSSGAPAELDAYGGPGPHLQGYCYLQAGQTISRTGARGLTIEADCPLDVNANLRFEFHYGTFPEGAGSSSFRPGIRKNQPGWNGLASGPVIDPVTGSYGMAHVDVTLPAAMRNVPLNGGFAMTNTQDAVGPFFGYYIRAVNMDRPAGFSYHTLVYAGGQSARGMAQQLQNTHPTFANYYFQQMRRTQLEHASDVRIVVIINAGLNDRNESQPSVGPLKINDGDSPDAFADNVQAIIDWFTSTWQTHGWPADELAFVVMPSHPIALPDDGELASYRLAGRDVADRNTRTAAVDLAAITDADEMASQGWYISSSDRNHLSQAGLEAVGLRLVDALLGQSRHHRPSVSLAASI